jgi:hypothetical protein
MLEATLPIAGKMPKGRKWKKARYPCGPSTICRFCARPNQMPEAATIRNLSGVGISLLLGHRLERDTWVIVDLLNLSRKFNCQLNMRVTGTEEQPDGRWVVEGAFSRELRNSEFLELLS